MKTLDQARVKSEIIGRIALLRPDLRRRWGKMNAPQMVSHLNDSFISVMGLKYVSIEDVFRFRGLVKWCALYLPTRWPPGFPTRPEIDQEISGTPPGEFAADREKLLSLVEAFTRQPREFSFRPHPMFLEMTEWQWMRWGWLHTDHHLRQFGV